MKDLLPQTTRLALPALDAGDSPCGGASAERVYRVSFSSEFGLQRIRCRVSLTLSAGMGSVLPGNKGTVCTGNTLDCVNKKSEGTSTLSH